MTYTREEPPADVVWHEATLESREDWFDVLFKSLVVGLLMAIFVLLAWQAGDPPRVEVLPAPTTEATQVVPNEQGG